MPGGDETSSAALKSANLHSIEYLCVEESLEFLSLASAHTSDRTNKIYASWEVKNLQLDSSLELRTC